MAEWNVSPLLDQMTVGECLSSRNGISCYEVRHTSGQEFILKCVSVPESPEKVSALILTGAYADATAANEYYRRVADDLLAEYEAGKQLAACTNFMQFLGCQIVPKESGVGFDVYLLSAKALSLKAYLADNAMSHLRAVQLGIDLCVALDAARIAGYLFEDLKPENIFVSEDGSFMLGDLGLASTEDLKFRSLPEQYISAYTAPELCDIMASLNKTVDIYALGLLLYRIYNGNHSAFEDEKTTAKAADARRLAGDTLPAPLYADYELADIILKACAFEISDRYQTPDELRQALVDYAQRNELTESLIVPPIISDPEPLLPTAGEEPTEPVAFTDVDTLDDDFKQHFSPDTVSLNATVAAVRAEQAREEQAAQAAAASTAAPAPLPIPVETPAEVSAAETPAAEAPAVETPLAEAPAAEAPAAASEVPLTISADTDVDSLLAASDALLSSKPFVFPEAVHISELPASDAAEDTVPTDANADADEPADSAPDEAPALSQEYTDSGVDGEPEAPEQPKKKKRSPVGWILAAVAVVLLAAAIAVYCFTDFGRGLYHYFIRIDSLSVTQTTATSIQVALTSRTENPPVSIICQDIYGNPVEGIPADNQYTFTELTPGTQYTILLQPVGTHKLLGETTCTAATEPATEVLTFTASAGTEEGAVQLNLVVKEDNTEPESWLVSYSCDGSQTSVSTFSGHSTQLIGLSVGKEYTFTLTNTADCYVTGVTTATYTPVREVTAEAFRLVSFIGDTLKVAWNCTSELPEGWTVTVTDSAGNQTSKDVTACEADISGLSVGENYLVELSATGLFQRVNLEVPANAIYVDSMTAVQQENGSISVSWECAETPEGGWLLVSSLGEADYLNDTRTLSETTATLNLAPNAAYTLLLKSADGRMVIGNCSVSLKTAEAADVNLLNVRTANLTMSTYLAPEAEDWSYNDLAGQTQTFAATDSIAFALVSSRKPSKSADPLTVLCVVRGSDGKIVDFSSERLVWNDMWASSRYTAKLPRTPQLAGDYTLELYISFKLAGTADFKVK